MSLLIIVQDVTLILIEDCWQRNPEISLLFFYNEEKITSLVAANGKRA